MTQDEHSIGESHFWDASDLERKQPLVARIGGIILSVLSVVGSVVAFNGGFDNTFIVANGEMKLLGVSLFALVAGVLLQIATSVVEFVYSNTKLHPAWLAAYSLDNGSNQFAYTPLLAPALVSIVVSLFGTATVADTARLAITLVAYIVSIVVVSIGTWLPEHVFVKQKEG